MKNKLIAILLISSLMSVSAIAADTDQAADADTAAEEAKVKTETEYIDKTGFSLWYNEEALKISDYGGQLCFIPVEEEDALKAPSVLIIVPNEEGETPSPLTEVTALYPPEDVSEIEELTTEEGITIQSVEATEDGKNFTFYIISYEDFSLNITSMIAEEEYETYLKEFDAVIETISFSEKTESTDEETSEETEE